MEEQNEKVTVKQVAIKWGLILGIISVVLFLTIYFGGLTGNSWAGWIGPIFTIVIMYLAHKEFKEQGDGYMNYGQGLGLGTLVATVSSAISSIFVYIYIKFINTEYTQEIQDIMRSKFEDDGMSDDQIDTAMGFMEKLSSPEISLIVGILGGIFIGFIIALIVSAITKNNDPSLEV